MSQYRQSGPWDGPVYRVRTDHFEDSFVLHAGEDLESVDNVDVFVDLPDGSRWRATIMTAAQVDP
ncbi:MULTISPECIES: hypothetical protein [unclassified Streptomyces]|uniref:hypothetical protein n=1 Tax=unclassified Streptomyces TaxID=2593676 RepID=UPI00386A95CD